MNIQPMKIYQADALIDRMRAASANVTPSDGRECSEQPTLWVILRARTDHLTPGGLLSRTDDTGLPR